MILADTNVLSTFARVDALPLLWDLFDLAGLLRAVWISNLRSKKFVAELVRRIEQPEGLVFRNKHAIFQRARR